jgi:transposase-like protein
MDLAAFSTWLAGIRGMDASQRARAFRELALAEATAADASSDEGPAAARRDDCAAAPSVVSGKTIASTPGASASGAGLLSDIGRDRIAQFGCPHCGGDDIRPWGKASGKPRYRCVGCGRTFNPLTGTPLAGLHYPDRWQDQARALISGETIAKAAERCGVDYTTAFRWRHRFLEALNRDKPASLSGIVEADETFILESFKGKRRGLPRAARKRGGKASKRGLSSEQIPVMVARDRSGATMDAVLPRLDAASITAALGRIITKPAQLCCDGGTAIKAFARRAKLTFHVLPAPGSPQPGAPDLHINNVNAYHSRLKEWLRRFHGVATANLPTYLSWRRTIEAFGTSSTPDVWLLGAAGLGPYQQASQ